MATFDGKSEKIELSEDLFQTSLKIHNQLTEGDKIDYFHSLLCGDALKTCKNITSFNGESLEKALTVFRRKCVKFQSLATTKHKFQRLVFNPVNQNVIDFLDKLQKLAKDSFGVAAQAVNEQFSYAKMPPILKKSINQAHSENCTYEQVVAHLEKGIGTEWLASSRWAANKNCEATSYTTKRRKTKINLPPLRKAKSLSEPVPSTQTR